MTQLLARQSLGNSETADKGRSAAPSVQRRWRHATVAGEALVGLHLVQVAVVSDLSVVGRVAFAASVIVVTTGLVALSLAQRAAWRGFGMLAVGLAGTLSGAGVGVMHLLSTGLSLTAVLGVIGLASGLALVVVGAAVLVRTLPGWWRLLALPAAIVVLQLVALTVPFSLYVTHVPIESFTAAIPVGATPVQLPTVDGVELSGWYTPSTNGAAVILRHGSGSASSKASTAEHAAVLARHGYGVLAMDARGHGQSGGQAMDWGWYGDTDVAAGVAWLAQRPDVDPGRIGGVGLSMGGEELVGAVTVESGLRAAVGEGVTGRTADDRQHFGYTGFQRIVDEATSAIMFGGADLMTRAVPPTALHTAVATMAGERVLLIAGEQPEEASAARFLQSAAIDGVVTVWELPDTPHIAALADHPEQWESRVVGFLDDALRP